MTKFDEKARKVDPDEVVNKLFADLPPEEEVLMELPSEGRFYKNGVASVTVRPMTYADEKAILALGTGSDPINYLISKCIDGAIPIRDLVAPDKLAILVKIREISFGAKYPAEVTCPKCGTSKETEIDLTSLVKRQVHESVTDPREVVLPKLGKTIKLRLPRVRDEELFKNADLLNSQLWRFVEEIDGITDPVVIGKAVARLYLKDRRFIRNELFKPLGGIDPRFIYHCGQCDKESEMEVPINNDFFTGT